MIIYRQVYDRVFKRWSIPSKSMDNGKKWTRVSKPERFCTTRDGIAFALWRMRKVLIQRGYPVTEIDKQKTRKTSVFTFKLLNY